jgi:comEA protein
MKHLLFASALSVLLMPCFSYATTQTIAKEHARHIKTHVTKSRYAQPVDINQADATQLTTLKGIGPKKAAQIIAYRTAHGAFKTVADLGAVKGIGAKAVTRLQASNLGRLVVNKGDKVE